MISREVSATPSSLLLPPGWVDQDIGAVGFTGGASYSAGTFSIKGSGSDIWGTADGFNYCYQTVSGDGAIVARVTSVQNTSSYAKASVMFRESALANSAHVSMQVNPNGSVDFTYRTATGASSADAGWTGIGTPKWLKLVRSGTSFSGYYSTNGTSWIQLGTAVTIPLSNDMLAGIAVSAVNNSALNTSTIDNVSLTGFGSPVTPTGLTASQLLGGINLQWNATNLTTSYAIKRATASGGPYTTIATSPVNSFTDLSVANRTTYYYVVSALNALGESGNSGQASATSNSLPLPTGWLDKDIGSVGLAGNADYENGAFTVRGSGADIWGTADAFNFCYRPVSGSSSITARVTSMQNTSSTAKAGVMFRDSTTATGGRYAMISVSPGAGIKFEYRLHNNGSASSGGTANGTAPVYLRLTRTNKTFTASYSYDGTIWTQVGIARHYQQDGHQRLSGICRMCRQQFGIEYRRVRSGHRIQLCPASHPAGPHGHRRRCPSDFELVNGCRSHQLSCEARHQQRRALCDNGQSHGRNLYRHPGFRRNDLLLRRLGTDGRCRKSEFRASQRLVLHCQSRQHRWDSPRSPQATRSI